MATGSSNGFSGDFHEYPAEGSKESLTNADQPDQ
jgi:hypothetical protein